jgi:hypothetical protein
LRWRNVSSPSSTPCTRRWGVAQGVHGRWRIEGGVGVVPCDVPPRPPRREAVLELPWIVCDTLLASEAARRCQKRVEDGTTVIVLDLSTFLR